MNFKTLLCKALLLTATLSLPCYGQSIEDIRLNQLGFFTFGKKIGVVKIPSATKFQITSPDLKTIFYEGNLGESITWKSSGEQVKVADFSSFVKPGGYVLLIPGSVNSYKFSINNQVITPVSKGALKAFYYNRASTGLPAQYAGIWNRAAGHPDDKVIVHASAADDKRPAGTIISSPRGWYDAGDYNKYIVNSGISTYTLLAAYEQYPTYYDTLKTNIPESSNAIPDILDEALWNVRWILTMQDPNDGGVYNKVTNAGFDGMIMPEKATQPRYVVAKGTAAAFDFCAVTAVMSRIAKKYDQQLPGLSDSCLTASKKAWEWALAHPNMPYNNPGAIKAGNTTYPAVSTGGYGDSNFSDEKSWAAAELYITTKENQYYNLIGIASSNYSIPAWANVNTLGLLSLVRHRKALTSVADTNIILDKLFGISKKLRDVQRDSSPYKIPEIRFDWGSNSEIANAGILLLSAYEVTKDITYYDAAHSALDYILGRNATTYSMVTGFGSKSTMNPHHRPSVADGIKAPIPGWLAGGPHNGPGDNCAKGPYPANTYNDLDGCYATNEIAINWNAPLVFLTGGVDFLKPTEVTTGVEEEERGLRSTFNIYPNPSSGNFSCVFSSNASQKVQVSVMDVTGKEQIPVREQEANQVFSINEQLAPGVYFVKARTDSRVLTQKIVVIE